MAPPLDITNWKTITNAGFTRIDAILPVPGHPGHVYVFRGSQYIRIILNLSSLSDTLHNQGPYNIATMWSSISGAGFTVVDAVVPVPGRANDAYIFSGSKYIRITIDPYSLQDSLVNGPYQIADKWPSLATSKFTAIDATLPVPGKPEQVYFFRGSEYVRVIFDHSLRDTIHHNGPYKIADLWPTITQAGFTTVDAAMPVPGTDNQSYIFNGSKYIRIKLDHSTLADTRLY